MKKTQQQIKINQAANIQRFLNEAFKTGSIFVEPSQTAEFNVFTSANSYLTNKEDLYIWKISKGENIYDKEKRKLIPSPKDAYGFSYFNYDNGTQPDFNEIEFQTSRNTLFETIKDISNFLFQIQINTASENYLYIKH